MNKCHICGGFEKLEKHHLRFKRFNGGSKKGNIEYYCKPCHEKLHASITCAALTIYFNLEDLSRDNPFFHGLIEMLVNKDLPRK